MAKLFIGCFLRVELLNFIAKQKKLFYELFCFVFKNIGKFGQDRIKSVKYSCTKFSFVKK